MKGSVSKYRMTAGTRWMIRYDAPRRQDGRRRQIIKRGFRRERDAALALREVLTRVDKGTHVDPSKVTLREYLVDEWLPARAPGDPEAGRGHRGKVAIGTWTKYRTDLEAYVIPSVGHIRLQELRPDDLAALYDDLEQTGGRAGRGLSAKSVVNVHGVIHKALTDAVRRGRVARNVADAVERPRASRPRTEVWSVDQLRRFLDQVRQDRLYAMWLLFATTGMRRGEVLGLTWSDLDLDAGRARVEWTLGPVDSRPTFKRRPKSEASERTMALDPATVEALRAWRRRQLEDRVMFGPGWRDREVDWRGTEREGLVFTRPDGGLLNPERVSAWFTVHVRRAGLPRIRLHDVRHTYATAALANATGWHEVKVISQRLGHASVGITLDTYSHVLPAADEETAHTLARVILGEGA